jgi:hypothetical protein
MKSGLKNMFILSAVILVINACQYLPKDSHTQQLAKTIEALGEQDFPMDIKQIELVANILGYDNFAIIEEGVYIANDSSRIIIFLPEKWQNHIEKVSLKFPYDVIDYPTKEKYLELEYPEHFSDFKFVGIIELYEHALNLSEYLNQEGKLFTKTDKDNVFWNIDADEWFDPGKNITNIVIIE